MILARINLVKLIYKAGLLFTVGSTIVQLLVQFGPALGTFLMDAERHARIWTMTVDYFKTLWT